jgi:hypothetical protein
MVHGCRTGCGIVTTVSTVSNVSAGQTLRRADGADAAHIDRVSPLSQMSKLDRISSFGFHAAVTRQERRYPRAGGAATRALWELYPEAIHNFIAQRGVRSSHMFI